MKLLLRKIHLPRFNTQRAIVLIFLLLVLSFLSLGLKLVRTAKAQIPNPPVPCEDERFPEFQSLRPYQASPCNDEVEDAALFCGNDLVLQDSITVTRNDAFNCYYLGNGIEDCVFEVVRQKNLAIDVSGAELPIMGRTQDDAINSQNQTESLDDAAKVNDYITWYLNGVNLPAEYGALDTDNEEDVSKLVNFSGPINKLLPERIKRDRIKDAISEAEDSRHNQVVGCINGFGQIAECYPARPLVRPVRLADLEANLPPDEEDFPEYRDFLQAYLSWRGETCINLPVFGRICINDPTRPDYWGNLFYRVPLASTEDRLGEIEVVQPAIQPVSPNLTISGVRIITTPADLFFPHMEDARGLADILQDTFVPQGNAESGSVVGVSPGESCDLTNIRTNPGDDLFAGEIGVNLSYTANFSCQFSTSESSEPPTNLCNFASAGEGECVPSDWTCDTNYGSLFCNIAYGNGYWCGGDCAQPNPSCTVTAQVVLNTVTKTPLADEIWSRLVAGASAVFKRIFPRVEPGAPVEGILDIPGATKVSYSASDGTPIVAGNPGNQRDGESAELYFPHVGGLQQYLLQCVQTALRPQGFGEACLSGEPSTLSGSCSVPGSLPNLSGGSCGLCNTGALSGLVPPLMEQIIEAAGSEYQVPPSLILGILAAEGGLERYQWTDDLVRQASVCGGQVPNCSTYNVSATGAVGAFQWIPFWFGDYSDAVNVVDSSRTGDPCNFLDAAFAAAKKLKYERGGAVSYIPPSCGGILYNTVGNGRGISTSCSGWTDSDAATAIRQYVGACNVGYQSFAMSYFHSYRCQ